MELTAFQANNPEEDGTISRLILEKLNLAAEQVSLSGTVENSAGQLSSEIKLLSSW
jgi:hypothetical protein